MSFHRVAGAVGIGGASVIGGHMICVVGMALGIPVQASVKDTSSGFGKVVDGIVDGSAAILARSLVSYKAPDTRPLARGYAMGFKAIPPINLPI